VVTKLIRNIGYGVGNFFWGGFFGQGNSWEKPNQACGKTDFQFNGKIAWEEWKA
jgi:hypothetical protein